MGIVEDILSSALGRKAVETSKVYRRGRPCAANLLRECVEEIEKLARHCQLPEFTEHGLPHLLSMIRRIDTWTTRAGNAILDNMDPDEAFVLFLSVLTHDIGMLTQNEQDLADSERARFSRVSTDLPSWVRRTHVPRLRKILVRLFSRDYPDFVQSDWFRLCCAVAESHQGWPGDHYYLNLMDCAQLCSSSPRRFSGLAGVLAVADLLDEDSSRCDSMTLFINKFGNLMNRAHWLRHMLTCEQLRVTSGEVLVNFRVPSNLNGKTENALRGLRNHLRLSERYNTVLCHLDAMVRVTFDDKRELGEEVPNLPSLSLLLCQPDLHLMRTFWEEALPRASAECPPGSCVEQNGVQLETVDWSMLDRVLGSAGLRSARSDYEITFLAAAYEGASARKEASHILREAAWEAHDRGSVKEVRRLASLVLSGTPDSSPRAQGINLEEFGWAAVLSFHWATSVFSLHELDRLFGLEKKLEPAALRHLLERLSPTWRPLALIPVAARYGANPTWDLVLDTLRDRLSSEAPLAREEVLSWYNLIEVLWGRGWFHSDPREEFEELFRTLCIMESTQNVIRPELLELAWRMGVQSRCLRGYERWEGFEAPPWALSPEDGSREMARVWIAWFHHPHSKDLVESVMETRRANPPGSEFCGPAHDAFHAVAFHELHLFRNALKDPEWRLSNSEAFVAVPLCQDR